jgi:HD-GYP domain-containing protein (c-di-GMP phosphodiesterase class II)
MSAAVDVVVALSAGRKANQLYPKEHPAFVEAIEGIVSAIGTATQSGSFQLNIHKGRLYQESDVLPDDVPAVTSMQEAFETRRIESMTLHPGLSYDESISLVEVLSLKTSSDIDVEAELETRGVEHVTLAMLEDEDSDERAERERLRAQDRAQYNKLVGALREISAQVSSGATTDLANASRMVGAILKRLMDDQSAVLGLATIRGQTEAGLFHSINVMIYSLTLGSALGLPEQGLASLGLSALLHDIGKSAFDPQDPSQAEPMHRMHPRIGADILSRLPDEDKSPMLVAYEHHMHVDGGGFPERDPEYVSHPYSRMVAIANRYANLTAPAAEREALTPDKAIVEILREAGSRLDPLFSRLFTKAMGVFPVGCMVRLSDQSVGVVSKTGEDLLAPVVRIVYDGSGLAVEDPEDVALEESEFEIIEVVDPESLDDEVSEHL